MNSSPQSTGVEAPSSAFPSADLYRNLRVAGQVSNLLLWIERARQLTDAIAFWAEHDERLAEALNSHRLPVNNCSWDEDESDALEGLLSLQLSLVRKTTESLARAA